MGYDWIFEGSNVSPDIPLHEMTKFLERFPNPRYISSGGYKDVWDIGFDRVLAIYQDRNWHSEHKFCQEVWKKKRPWSVHEPVVYEVGELPFGHYYAIIERFDIVTEETPMDDELYDIIIQIDNAVYDVLIEKELEDTCCFPSQMTKAKYSSVDHLAKMAVMKTRFGLEYIDKITRVTSELNLSYDWLEVLAEDIVYKSITDRYGDLHSGNLGFRLSDRRPVFFDW
jgi:hypothetical protein